MREAAASVLILAVTMNFLALGTSNLKACIRAAALQGFLVSVFPLLFTPAPTLRLLGFVVVAGIVKAFVIPGMLTRALREVHIQHEVDPYLGLVPSVLLLAVGTGTTRRSRCAGMRGSRLAQRVVAPVPTARRSTEGTRPR